MALSYANVKAEIVEISEFENLGDTPRPAAEPAERFGAATTPTTVFDGRLIVRRRAEEAQLAGLAPRSTAASGVLRIIDAGPTTLFDTRIEKQVAAESESAPRRYVPGR